jgi:hypothetical protein
MAAEMDAEQARELRDLYTELHLVCGRAATLLRLGSAAGAPEGELLDMFLREEERAAAIWRLIAERQRF